MENSNKEENITSTTTTVIKAVKETEAVTKKNNQELKKYLRNL